MGNTAAVVWPASLASLVVVLRLLRAESTAAHRAMPWAMPIGSADDLLRALEILDQLRDRGGSITRGSAPPDPKAPAARQDLLKLPSLFTEGKMFPAMPLF